MRLYDVNEIGVSYRDECVQETAGDDDVRSFIYGPDGHMYTHWGKTGSIIF